MRDQNLNHQVQIKDTIDVPVKGSTDFASYVKANDNVDGDVTPFIEANTPLNTEVKGQQDITLKATDSSGNETVKTFTFAVSDLEAPVINLTQGENVTVDYGSGFDLNNFVNVTDNLDGTLVPTVEGSIDTSKIDETQTLKISATDSSGNVSEANLNVVVKDLSAPVISLTKSSITLPAPRASAAFPSAGSSIPYCVPRKKSGSAFRRTCTTVWDRCFRRPKCPFRR